MASRKTSPIRPVHVVVAVLAVAAAALAYLAVRHTASTPPARADEPSPVITPEPTRTGPTLSGLQVRPVIAALGSSLTAGNGATKYANIWAYRLQLALGDPVKVDGYPGHTMRQIIDAGGVQKVVGQRPGVVLVEAGAPNDYGQNVPIADSVAALREALTSLKRALPDAQVIFQTGNPIGGGDAPNDVGATYADYNRAELRAARAAGVDVFDLYRAFLRRAHPLAGYLRDGIHPNDQGNALWVSLLEAHFGVTR